MRYLAILVLLLVPACSQPEYPRQAVHLVEVPGGNGSGVMIDKFLMLTAAHVIGDGNNVTVGPKKYPAKLILKDEKLDIALLHVAIDCPCTPLADIPAMDDKVVVIGFPVNQHVGMQVMTEGRVQGILENRMQLAASVAGGNSGGGVFVVQHGEWKLAGIISQVVGWCIEFSCYPAMHLSRAVDPITMRNFVARAEI